MQFLRALMPAALLSRRFRRAVTLQSLTSTTCTTHCAGIMLPAASSAALAYT